MAAIFLTIYLYSSSAAIWRFYLLWQKYCYLTQSFMAKLYSYQCFHTETSAQDNKSYTTETPSISYSSFLYIRLVVTL